MYTSLPGNLELKSVDIAYMYSRSVLYNEKAAVARSGATLTAKHFVLWQNDTHDACRHSLHSKKGRK